MWRYIRKELIPGVLAMLGLLALGVAVSIVASGKW